MVAEVEVLLHVDDIVVAVSVSPPYRVQDLQLHQCLMMEPAARQHTPSQRGILVAQRASGPDQQRVLGLAWISNLNCALNH